MNDITFITMHDLSPEARLVYASHSITEVLGYDCQEIVGRSCFEYFHPDERPFAQSVYGRGVELDKAAVLSYCRLKTADGHYVTCECIFTVVYSVIVASTSLYWRTSRSQGRAIAAPAIRRAFSLPADPRFHILTHLSEKFRALPSGTHEPRAALILNRFTKTSSILYASSALNDLLGVELDGSVGISFYECIQREYLEDAIQAIEQAKEYDSIAYLRFIWRNPGEDLGGWDPAHGGGNNSAAASGNANERAQQQLSSSAGGSSGGLQSLLGYSNGLNSSLNGEGSSNNNGAARPRLSVGDEPTSRLGSAPGLGVQASVQAATVMEAVVSCTSDGLVVVLRKARPTIPSTRILELPIGQFVSPWSAAASASRGRNAEEMDAQILFQYPVSAASTSWTASARYPCLP
ncbi:hypothetical protein HOY80DRAFT_1004124 [Tuber brumale]|nr:hypothetical protein HOY80DRAFT_1004124 [Tuber brumale]